MRVLVCGGRNFSDRDLLLRTLDALDETDDPTADAGRVSCVIEGGAGGADRLARAWAECEGKAAVTYLAEWDKHGKAAGPIRNQRMLDEGRPDLVVAFPGGRGTADMVRRARAAGVPVMEVA
jgi:hypothetical protein